MTLHNEGEFRFTLLLFMLLRERDASSDDCWVKATMNEPMSVGGMGRNIELAVSAHNDQGWDSWNARLVYFLRAMAVLSMIKGLLAWAAVCGFLSVGAGGFEAQPLSWQTATVFFAVFDLVAAVGLWLAAPWGAVVWLTSSISLITLELLFPRIYGTSLATLVMTSILVCAYMALAIMAARTSQQ